MFHVQLISAIAFSLGTRSDFVKCLQQSFGFTLSVPGSDLEYYRATYNISYYKDLPYDFIFHTSGSLGYGNGYGSTSSLPFYKHFYARF